MYEYQVIPAPNRAPKIKGVKLAAERFAHTLTELMNEAAADGWEYVRTDTLPLSESAGLMRKGSTSFQNLMVFRRLIAGQETQSPAAAMQQQMQEQRFAEPPVSRRPDLLREPDPFAEPEPRSDEIVRQAPAPRVDKVVEDDMILRGRSLSPDTPTADPGPAEQTGSYRPLGGVGKNDR